MHMWEKDGVCLLFIGQRASLQRMKWNTETLQNIWLNGCSIYTCITDACLSQTMMYSFLSCLKVNELTRLGLLTQTRCDWSVFILQQDLVRICGGVRERVSVWFVYPCMMEDLLMQKAWDAECFFQICCYGDKYLAESILHSNNLVLCVVKRLYVISTVSYHHLVRHIFKVHHSIRPFLSKKGIWRSGS